MKKAEEIAQLLTGSRQFINSYALIEDTKLGREILDRTWKVAKDSYPTHQPVFTPIPYVLIEAIGTIYALMAGAEQTDWDERLEMACHILGIPILVEFKNDNRHYELTAKDFRQLAGKEIGSQVEYDGKPGVVVTRSYKSSRNAKLVIVDASLIDFGSVSAAA